MLIAPKFTPEVLIEAPRRGAAIPNYNGTLALYTVSTHTIGKGTLKEVRVMNIETGDSAQISDSSEVREANWLGDNSNTIIYLKSAEKGVTLVMVANADDPSKEAYIVEEIPAPVSQLKVKELEDGSIAFAIVGLVDSDGNLFNEKTVETKSTVRVYDTYQARFWDSYLKPQKYTIWYSKLVQSNNKWTLTAPLYNAIPGSNIEAPMGMYDGLSGGTGAFDICSAGIVFVAEDPENKDPFYQGISDVYYVPLESFSSASTKEARKVPITQDSSPAAYSNPRFSPDGSMIAFLRRPLSRMQDNRIYLGHIDDYGALDVFRMVTGTEWDLIPESFEFTLDGHSLLLQAQDCARLGLYELELQPHAKPKTILRSGSVSAFYPLVRSAGNKGNKLLVTWTSLVENSLYQIIDAKGREGPKVVSSASKNGSRLGLSPHQVSEIYFEGAGDYCVQAWVVKPRDFDEKKKYPLAMIIHGGPQSAWLEAWSTRWNPAAWAEQGYIVVAPNPAGSTGFGIDFTELVHGSWGGLPYQDIVNCLEYLKDMPGIDLDNAVCGGGSYGGYMVNWINGNPLGRKFKCLVSHDGIYHLPAANMMSDAVGIQEDFLGPPYIWDTKSNEEMEKWNPARPDLLKNWKTPMMIIHSDKDYRCPVTDGIAAHTTLQSLGTPSRFVNFPDENHFVLKEENSLAWHRLVFEWINKWSGVDKGKRE